MVLQNMNQWQSLHNCVDGSWRFGDGATPTFLTVIFVSRETLIKLSAFHSRSS